MANLMIAVVFFRDDTPGSVDAITQDIEARWNDLPYATAAEENELVLSFNLGSLAVAIGRMRAPYPWSDLEGPCATSLFWPTAAEELKPLRHHWIVTVTDSAPPLRLAMLLTKVTASVLATSPSAVGVYWGGSTLVLPKELFVKGAAACSLRDPPLEMWVDFRTRRDGRKTSCGFTQGMRALGHKDFETRSAPESPLQLRDRLVSMAYYVVVDRGVIRDGDTVGKDAREKIRVTYADSMFGNRHQVMRLNFDPRPKWRFW